MVEGFDREQLGRFAGWLPPVGDTMRLRFKSREVRFSVPDGL